MDKDWFWKKKTSIFKFNTYNLHIYSEFLSQLAVSLAWVSQRAGYDYNFPFHGRTADKFHKLYLTILLPLLAKYTCLAWQEEKISQIDLFTFMI